MSYLEFYMKPNKQTRWLQRYENFNKAFIQLESVVLMNKPLSDLEKEGMIQRFEYTFELAWKTLKDYLDSQEVTASFPREVIKQSFHHELIDNGEVWMDMLEQRNLLAHTYNEKNFLLAIDLIKNHYFSEINKLHQLLNNKQNIEKQ